MSNLSAFLDFELNISDLDGDLFTVVVRSDAGEVREVATFPYDETSLEKELLKLENAVLRSTEAHRTVQTSQSETVESFGRTLFDFVLPGEARSLYNECMREAAHRHRGVRLKLSIHSPRLAALPWEFLYDPRKRDYICLNPYTPLVRYTELPQTTPPLTIEAPLRILGLVSDPADMPMRLDVEEERQRVSAAIHSLEARGLVELTWMESNNWRDLQRIMRTATDEWHVLHFIGHGGYDQQRNEGYIVLGDDDGTSHYLYASQLARLLARQHASMRLVLLNACDGARSGLQDTLSSTAATLINSGIPAVLAMQYEITDTAAVEFANAFYEALADNLPVDAAVAEARNAISLNDVRSLEWGVPVLHMRAADGRLFSIADTERVLERGTSRPHSHALPQFAPGSSYGSLANGAPAKGSPASGSTVTVPPHRKQTQSTPHLPTADQGEIYPLSNDNQERGLQEQRNGEAEGLVPTYVADEELTAALSAALEAHGTGSPSVPVPNVPRQWWEVVETLEDLDEAVVLEASARIQLITDPAYVDRTLLNGTSDDRPVDPLAAIGAELQERALLAACVADEDDLWTDEGEEEDEFPIVTEPDEDGITTAKAALEERSRLFTESVDPLDVHTLLRSYTQRQHTLIGIDWVKIPAGEFLMGSDPHRDVHMFADEAPQFVMYLDTYHISRSPVTNAQYKLFVVATGYPAPMHWLHGEIPPGEEPHPVVNVNWHDATAFCEWAGVRLPTEAEWEKAARGEDGRLYPWGNESPDGTRCNFELTVGMTVPVGRYPKGASPYGVLDMAGNIWEWTASVWLDSYENYTEQLHVNAHKTLRRVLRGGGFRDVEFVRCASRSWDLPNQRYRDLGFRVAT